jgi:RNA polymerase sigma-70 factor (ECF subfamily)
MWPADEELADEILLLRIRQGDEAAFRRLFDRYMGPLYTLALQLTRVPDAADDVVADVFATLWDNRSSLSITSVRAYLFGAIRNRSYTVLHQMQRADVWNSRFLSTAESPGLGCPTDAADVQLESEERRHTILTAIESLPPRSRTVIWLRWITQLPFDEIAVIMETTEAAVRMQHSRALAQLRERLPKML